MFREGSISTVRNTESPGQTGVFPLLLTGVILGMFTLTMVVSYLTIKSPTALIYLYSEIYTVVSDGLTVMIRFDLAVGS